MAVLPMSPHLEHPAALPGPASNPGILSQSKVCLGGAGLEGPECNGTGGPPGQVEPAVSALPLDPEGSRALDAEHELGE